MISTIDRQNASRALAKAIAYADCGKQTEAEKWAIQLIRELQCLQILNQRCLALAYGENR